MTGDVRRALEIARLAAQIAEREEADAVEAGGTPDPNSVVTFSHINAAVKQLKGSVAQQALRGAPMHQQLLLACLVKLQESSGRSEVSPLLSNSGCRTCLPANTCMPRGTPGGCRVSRTSSYAC